MTRPHTSYTPATSIIDPTAPGGIQALLDFHRATFGDARMEDTNTTGEVADAAANGDTGAGSEDGAPAGAGEQADTTGAIAADVIASGDTGKDPWSDPTRAKAEIEKLRREAAAARTKTRDDAKAAGAQEARDALTQELGKALGLIKDGDQTPDPEALAKAAQEAQAAATQAQLELAVYRAAGQHSADPDALLDSRSFLSKVKGLDPTNDDFTNQVASLIEETVTNNPKLKTVQVAAKSGPDLTGGTGEKKGQLTREQFAALSPEDRLKAVKDGRAKTILTGQ